MHPILNRMIGIATLAPAAIPMLCSLALLCATDGRAQTHPIAIHPGQHTAVLQMTPSEYAAWIAEDGFTDTPTLQALVKDIYATFRDEFDFIFLVLNESRTPPGLGYAGMLRPVSNQVSGLGQDLFDESAEYGSGGRLKSVMALAVNSVIMGNLSLHELMHNWGNFGIKTAGFDSTAGAGSINEYRPHWGFTGGSGPGVLGGFRQDSLVSNVDGNPKRYRVARFLPHDGANSVPFNQMELYLAGFIPLSQVAPFDVFRDITAFEGYPLPQFFFEADTRIRYDSARILSELGPRVPSVATSQKSFRLLTVVLTGSPLADSAWDSIEGDAEAFGRPASEGTFSYNFWEATGGRATVETGNLKTALKSSFILARPTRRDPAQARAFPGGVFYNPLGRRIRFPQRTVRVVPE